MRRVGEVRPLPGAQELLDTQTQLGVPWAIADLLVHVDELDIRTH